MLFGTLSGIGRLSLLSALLVGMGCGGCGDGAVEGSTDPQVAKTGLCGELPKMDDGRYFDLRLAELLGDGACEPHSTYSAGERCFPRRAYWDVGGRFVEEDGHGELPFPDEMLPPFILLQLQKRGGFDWVGKAFLIPVQGSMRSCDETGCTLLVAEPPADLRWPMLWFQECASPPVAMLQGP